MSTRSLIAFSTPQGVEVIHCRQDGYLNYNGKILQECYTQLWQVEELMDLGDLANLGADVVTCDAYHRDKGEGRDENSSRVYSDFHEALLMEFDEGDAEYFYIFLQNSEWAVINRKTAESLGARKLSDALAELRRAQMHSV
jgi:hypothetical protein